MSETVLAVDVLFHKSVIDSCMASPDGEVVNRSNDDSTAAFKQQIVELASAWITSDIGIAFNSSWTACADPYFGTEQFLFLCNYVHHSDERSSATVRRCSANITVVDSSTYIP